MTNNLAHVENPSDRITIQQVPQSAPGQCGICGKGQDPDGFVDPQLDFEYWGALIFCRECTTQMAAIYGLISPEVYGEIVAEVGLLQLQLNEVNKKNARLEGVVSGLTGYWNTDKRSIDSSPGAAVPTTPSIESSSESTSSNEPDSDTQLKRIDDEDNGESDTPPKPLQF